MDLVYLSWPKKEKKKNKDDKGEIVYTISIII